MKYFLLYILFSGVCVITGYSQTAAPDANGVLYVKQGGAGTGMGNSWGNAMAELGPALDSAKKLNTTPGTVKQIWVAAGTYKPTRQIDGGTGNDRNKSFWLLKDVAVYGHFRGTETSIGERSTNMTSYVTTLSGDLGTSSINDNACHVVVASNITGVLVDGFTITAGNADGPGDVSVDGITLYPAFGGGMYITSHANVTISNVVFDSNTSGFEGGGAFVFTSSTASFQNVTFRNNAGDNGGGISAMSNSRCTYTNVSFTNNQATGAYGGGDGGAVCHSSSAIAELNNVSVTGNTSQRNGAGIYIGSGSNTTANRLEVRGNYSHANGGGIYQTEASASYTNTLIAGNLANNGGGLYCNNTSYQFVNVTVAGNNAIVSGGGVLSAQSSGVINNTVIGDNSSGIVEISGGSHNAQYSFLQGVAASSSLHNLNGNISPAFSNSPASGTAPFSGGAYTLQTGSPLVNKGSNALFSGLNASSVDLAGTPRVSNYTTGGIIEIGAYEKALLAQSIPVSNISKNYGDADFELTFTASSGGPVTYASSDAGIITVYQDASDGNKWKASIKKVGSVTITASQEGTTTYDPTSVTFTISVAKALLVVTANNFTKVYDATAFNGGNGVVFTGFAYTDGAASLGGTLSYGGGAQGRIHVGSNFTIVPSGYTSDNYTFSYIAGRLSVTQAPLTVTASDSTLTYKGIAFANGNGVVYTGFKGSDTNTVLTGTLQYTGNAQGAVNTGNYEIMPGGLTGADYSITYVKGTLHITPAPLLVKANAASRIYNGTAFYGGNGVSYAGFVNNETASVVSGTLSYTGNAQGSINTGGYAIEPQGLSAANYTITYDTGLLTIQTAPLTIKAQPAAKTYNGIAYSGGNGVTYTGFVNSETQTVLTGTLSYAGNAQGAVNAGGYAIAPQGVSAANYAITFDTGLLTINKAGLTITAKDSTKAYDAQAFAGGNGVAYSGFKGSDDATALTGTLAYEGDAQSAANVGAYVIVPKGLAADNYNITFAQGALHITPVALTITAKDSVKTYDGVVFNGGNGVVYSGFVSGEDKTVLGGTLAFSGTSQGAVQANAGYTIIPSGLTSGNYTITYTAGALAINQAALTVKAQPAAKIYDGVAYSGGNGATYTGFINSENQTVLTGTLSYAGNAQGAVNAGGYAIAPQGLSAANYTITYDTGLLVINKTALTIKAKAAAKTYDAAAFTGGNGVTYTGFVHNETETVLTGSVSYAGNAQGAVNAGGYAIAPQGVSAANYAITFDTGLLTINKAGLTITAKDSTKAYDTQAFAGGNGVVYSGFKGSDDATVLTGTLAYEGDAQSAANVGVYAIVPKGLAAANYDVAFAQGALHITPVALIITAKDSVKTYDGVAFNGGNGVVYSGFVSGEDKTVLGGTLAFSGTSQGAVQANTGYTIIPSGLTSGNYAITFNAGTLTIGKAALTVKAQPAAKTYDGIAYTGGNGATYTGFVNSENQTVLTGTLSYAGNAQGAVNAGGYAIAPQGLSAANYTINYDTGLLVINKAALTIKAKAAAKTYDAVAFTGGNGVTYAGFVHNETETVLAGSVSYAGNAQGAVNAGGYAIAPQGLSAANYTVTFDTGLLTINKAGLTITAKDSTKAYDTQAFAGGNGVAYSGFKGSDDATVLTGTLAYEGDAQNAANVGVYAIVPKGLAAANYDVTFAQGALHITPVALTITAKDSVKTYDGVAFNGGNGVVYSGFVSGEDKAVLGGTLAFSGTSQGAVQANTGYTIIPSGLTSGNYTITFNAGTLTIGKAALTVTAKDSTKVYDATAFNGGNGVTYAGFVQGEDATVLNGAVAFNGTSQGAVNVADNYVITPAGLSADNYTISYANGTLAITPATLEVTANNDSVTYSGTAYSGGKGVAFRGFKGVDDAAVLGGTLQYTGSAQGAVNAGTYSINPGGYTSGNYTISYVNGTLIMGKAPLTITADNKARCYGVANPAFTFSYTGWVNNEGTAALSTLPSAATSAAVTTPAGSYAIIPSGAAAANYAIAYSNGMLVTHALPVSRVSAPDGAVLCGANGTVNLSASGAGTYTYQWLLSNAAITGGSNGVLTATATGAYTAVATDSNSCVANASGAIAVTRLLPPTVAFSYDTYCAGTPVRFTNASDISASGAVTYTWYSGDGQTATGNNARFTYLAAGNYTAALTVTPATCPALATTLTKNIAIEAPVAGVRLANVNTTAYLPTPLAARTLPNAVYTWQPGTGLSNTGIYNPVATLSGNQEYTIRMDVPSGCVTIDTLLVTALVSNDVLVANVFTPNGDGQNDVLLSNLRGNIRLLYFRVFNRAGKKLFESSDPARGWDGRVNGELQPMATYVWTAEAVDANGRVFHRQGSFTLLR